MPGSAVVLPRSALELPSRDFPLAMPTIACDVAITVPVYNELIALEGSIRRLHGFLSSEFPFSWQIVIADNASTDGTLALARRLTYELDGLDVIHLPVKGRGRALRAAWSSVPARVHCYMDLDLSTDLSALLPLVAPLLSGHSDIAIGTRLHRDARVQRSPRRELISRCYNRLLRVSLRARFSDAQCGFKAIRGGLVAELLPLVRDQEWFFDTELLVLAQRRDCGSTRCPSTGSRIRTRACRSWRRRSPISAGLRGCWVADGSRRLLR
jgi:glycosyltransferase involved in cell wall biosynthesis